MKLDVSYHNEYKKSQIYILTMTNIYSTYSTLLHIIWKPRNVHCIVLCNNKRHLHFILFNSSQSLYQIFPCILVISNGINYTNLNSFKILCLFKYSINFDGTLYFLCSSYIFKNRTILTKMALVWVLCLMWLTLMRGSQF